MACLKDKKLFLLDMDGTLYLDETLFPGVLEFLELIRVRGGRYLFLTNNSSRSVEDYLKKMESLGILARAEDFITSLDATIALLQKEYVPKRIYALGTRSMQSQLLAAGFELGEEPTADIDLLLVGFDRELNYKKLEDACRLLGRDIPYLATNPDWVCPTDFGYVPDCGSICEMLEHATGRRPRFIGKPEPDMVRLALKRTGFTPEQCLLIGDRLYTDIACGLKAGVETAFVLSGEGKEEDIERMGIRPDRIFADIQALLRRMEEEIASDESK